MIMRHFLLWLLMGVCFPNLYGQNVNISYPMQLEGRWGYVNPSKEWQISPQFEYAGPFSKNDWAVVRMNHKYGVINSQGEIKIPCQFQHIKILPHVQMLAVKQKGKWGLMNIHKNLILACEYIDIQAVKEPVVDSNLVFIRSEAGWDLANTSGQILSSYRFSQIKALGAKLLKVRKKEAYGLMNTQGELLVDCSYDAVRPLDENFVSVSRDQKQGLVSIKAGGLIIKSKYSKIQPYTLEAQNKRYFLIHDGDKVGLANAQGQVIMEPKKGQKIKYDGANHVFGINVKDKWGMVSILTDRWIRPKFDQISSFINGVALVKLGDKKGLINRLGEVVLEPIYLNIKLSPSRASYTNLEGLNEFLSFDNQGKVIGRYQGSKVRQIRVKKNTETENWTQPRWDFARPPAQRYVWAYSDSLKKWGLKLPNQKKLRYPIDVKITHFESQEDIPFTELFHSDQDDKGRTLKSLYNDTIPQAVLYRVPWNLDNIMNQFRTRKTAIIRPEDTQGETAGYVTCNGRLTLSTYDYDSGANNPSNPNPPLGYKIIEVEDFKKGYSKFRVRDPSREDQELWGLMAEDGNIVLKPAYSDIEIVQTEEQIFFVVSRKLSPRYGYIDTEGRSLVPIQFEKARVFSDGMAAVYGSLASNGRIYRWGFIDTTGKLVVPYRYRKCGDFHDSRSLVRDDGNYRYINKQGEEVIQGRFSYAKDFHQGLAKAGKRAGIHGLIDTLGNWVIPPKYMKIYTFNEQGLARIRVNDLTYSVINNQGERPTNEKFLAIHSFTNGIARVQTQDRKYNFMDSTGHLIANKSYDQARYFHEEIAAVKWKGFWGYIDKKGNTVLPFEYASASSFYKGYAYVVKDKKRLFIDRQGQLYDSLPPNTPWFNVNRCRTIREFKNGLAAVQIGNYWGFFNQKGNLIIRNTFEEVSDFYEGISRVKKRGKYFYINTEGIVVERSKVSSSVKAYFEVDDPAFWYYQVTFEKDKVGLVDDYGNVICEPKYSFIGEFKEGKAVIGLNYYKTLIPQIKNSTAKFNQNDRYLEINYMGNQTFQLIKEGKVGYWHSQRGWIWEIL